MKKIFSILILVLTLTTSCSQYNRVLKTTDYEYKYEAAKSLFAEGNYTQSQTILNELINVLKGTDKAEESVYMLGMCYYHKHDYVMASQTFKKYYTTYTRGMYTELARFYTGKALALNSPEAKLDQSTTYVAIQELQMFLELFPQSTRKVEADKLILQLEDKLVLKELRSSELYYNLGNYLGQNNFESCVITAQNALRDFPNTKYREDLAILILRSKYQSAHYSVAQKMAKRYRDVADECYAFKVDYSDSKYISEAKTLLEKAEEMIKKLPVLENEL